MSEELTPAQTEAVRRALRAARHDAPMPAEVATRLDDQLAELVAASAPSTRAAGVSVPSAGGPTDATVVPLDSRRRHRRRMTLLVAAAAVTVVGVGTTQLVPRSGEDASLTADRDRTAASAESDGRSALPETPSAGDVPEASTLDTLDSLLPGSVSLTPEQRAALTTAGYRNLRPSRAYADDALSSTASKSVRADAAYAAAGCAVDLPGDLPPSTGFYDARHDGHRVVLVVLPGPEVAAYPCAGGDPTRVPLD